MTADGRLRIVNLVPRPDPRRPWHGFINSRKCWYDPRRLMHEIGQRTVNHHRFGRVSALRPMEKP